MFSNLFLLFVLLVLSILHSCNSRIATDETSKYIRVRFTDCTTVNFYSAKEFCMSRYKSTLASIHSDDDYYEIIDIVDNYENAYIGLHDLRFNESIVNYTTKFNWEWTDGTDYDYQIKWDTKHNEINAPDNGAGADEGGEEDCVEFWKWNSPDYQFNDLSCLSNKTTFVCNARQDWYPIFKLQTNNTNYSCNSFNNSISIDNSADLWMYGSANFDNFLDEIEYLANNFTEYRIDPSTSRDKCLNYRSLFVDNDRLNTFFRHSIFRRIKISLYLDSEEIKYFIFKYNSESNYTSWLNYDNFIDGSYQDFYDTKENNPYHWSIKGMCA